MAEVLETDFTPLQLEALRAEHAGYFAYREKSPPEPDDDPFYVDRSGNLLTPEEQRAAAWWVLLQIYGSRTEAPERSWHRLQHPVRPFAAGLSPFR